MTTERHAWVSTQVTVSSTTAATTGAPRTGPPVCGCGQDLDVCARRHCPRCGSAVHR